jgi:hypothetical protein
MSWTEYLGMVPSRVAFLTFGAVAALTFAGCGRPSTQTAEANELVKGEPIAREVAGAAGSAPLPSAPTATASPAVAGGAAASNVATSTSGAKSVGTADDPLPVGFDKLASFSYVVPDGPVDTNQVASTSRPSQIPDNVRSLNDKFVSVRGFMLPLKVEKGLVTELLIMRDQSMCCYGTVPRINEWVSVKMLAQGIKPIMDQPVTLYGTLKVGEMYENGYLVGIYAMDGDRMAGPLDF